MTFGRWRERYKERKERESENLQRNERGVKMRVLLRIQIGKRER